MNAMNRYIIHEGTGTILSADECVVVNCDWEFDDIEANIPYMVSARGYMPNLDPKLRSMCNRCGIFEDTEEWIVEHFDCDLCQVTRCIDVVKVWNITDRNANYPGGLLLTKLLVCPKCYSHRSNPVVEVPDDKW